MFTIPYYPPGGTSVRIIRNEFKSLSHSGLRKSQDNTHNSDDIILHFDKNLPHWQN